MHTQESILFSQVNLLIWTWEIDCYVTLNYVTHMRPS